MSYEYESVLRRAVASGDFAGEEAALQHAIQLLAEEKKVARDTLPIADWTGGQPNESHEAWLKRYQAFVSRHRPTGQQMDDSRASIYADRN